jgi:glycosyltransferase involved in cell wall biosynthesis
MLGHRNFLALAPLLHLAAPTTPRWLLAYGIDVGPKFSRLERAFLRHVDRVFAISPQTATAVRQAGWHGPVDLWPCSLPFSWSLPSVVPPRFERPIRLLLVSRLYDRYKGIGHALRALRLLLDRGIAATLDVVGEGPDRAFLEGEAQDEAVTQSVKFHGRIETPALQQLYEACDVFVLPSCSEGFGIVYLEAMAYGKPVVGAEAGATPFVVRPGLSGFLVPYGDPGKLADCIAALAEHPDEARRVGLSARAFLEETFAFEHMVERTRAILNASEETPDVGGFLQ